MTSGALGASLGRSAFFAERACDNSISKAWRGISPNKKLQPARCRAGEAASKNTRGHPCELLEGTVEG